jgi:PEP-CTERM motif
MLTSRKGVVCKTQGREGRREMVGHVKLAVAMLLALLLVGVSGGDGWAGADFTVRIDDLTDTPSVTLITLAPCPPICVGPTILPDSSGEFLHFTLLSGGGGLFGVQAADLFEDFVGGTLSDRLVVTLAVANPNVLDVQFASDPATLTLPPGVTPAVFVENGDFQTMFTTIAAIGPYFFQVRSDVGSEHGDVPAPTTLLLLGAGLAGLAGLGARPRLRRPSALPAKE